MTKPCRDPAHLSVHSVGRPVCLWGTVALTVIALTFRPGAPRVELSSVDSMVASWYLCNGFFYNSMMDVFAGQFQSWQTMTHRYVMSAYGPSFDGPASH